MTKDQAIQSFWSSFGLTAYEENSVPDNAEMPYITYEVSTASFEHELPVSASIWYRDTSWVAITNKAEQIAKRLYKLRGTALPIEDGRFRIYESDTPLFQRMADESDGIVKRIVINVMVEFFTNY